MYLKSIEVHGFKSFANKILFEFHNGITGIVGPNGSGKSNVADAVRWVLGEQSARQLRGVSMQDVIFSGTENRKALSYAYVAITMDNADHMLPIEFEEVTIARRVYRSGESEYLINGSPCRLKDVTELFYDTGIGKEGYSIIGQGQIDRILSGKPEERRELFDEAAGIVKFKRRKATAQKKLAEERENLVRVNDILSELERQVGPLEKQAETAKKYLNIREELKSADVNRFLLEVEDIDGRLASLDEKFQIASKDLTETGEKEEQLKKEFEEIEQTIADLDAELEKTQNGMSEAGLMKEKLEGQINLLREQIRMTETSDEHFTGRLDAIKAEIAEKEKQKGAYDKTKETLEKELSDMVEKRKSAEDTLNNIRQEINRCNEGIEKGKNEIIALLSKRTEIKGRMERSDTMLEQVNIRKAELNRNLLQRKNEETDLKSVLQTHEERMAEVTEKIRSLEETRKEQEEKQHTFEKKEKEENDLLSDAYERFHQNQSRLESLRNIAERYEGYGNSTKRVMEKKGEEKGIHGVVADLVKVEKKYETAVETALGGNIQNVVTEDEETAKRLITYLKENHYGRVTFLPLTSVKGKDHEKNRSFLSEPGAIGFANELVKADKVYSEVLSYLLGRVIVVDHVDHAVALARKSGYGLHIVTLEGEYLAPGGSIAGGSFKNNSNLLGRKREIDTLTKAVKEGEEEIKAIKARREEIRVALSLLLEEQQENKQQLQEAYLAENTERISMEKAKEQWEESEKRFELLRKDSAEIDTQVKNIHTEKKEIEEALAASDAREKEVKKEGEELQKTLDEKIYLEDGAQRTLTELQMEEASLSQKETFSEENRTRVEKELADLKAETERLITQREESLKDVEKKKTDIEEIQKTILSANESYGSMEKELKEIRKRKEERQAEYKGFFERREEISKQKNGLDKEIFRLNTQREKLAEQKDYQINYMWNEYELTYHNAEALKDPERNDLSQLKRQSAKLRDELRQMGNVNVNAIEEFQEVNERYQFLKNQHDDLIESEKTLLLVIEDLDNGMREQFSEQFKAIQTEFNHAFRELFGGGKGELMLTEGEDLLESGIQISAQPPGKKLQSMQLLSGGEKALTAIALLFAIQNLKPSPFCLLYEIEAALDDSNVGRFAKYLHKLTKNTQFIVITHRRGTMAAADRLYGITMQEKGISTLVSVNLIEEELDA